MASKNFAPVFAPDAVIVIKGMVPEVGVEPTLFGL